MSPSPLLQELESYTRAQCKDWEMLIGGLEGALLKMMIRLSGARRVLEIGLFTGYSALTMAEAMPEDGEIISCDINKDTTETARSFLARSPHGHKVKIKIAPALETIASLSGPFDLVFIDADKENYRAYYDAVIPLLRAGGLLMADNVLWSGKVLEPKEQTDHALVRFNDRVHNDERVDHVLLTVRDGVMLAMKKP
ncbi:MAG: class I SAM-dependent methyltransferase [Gammaproteobacteria bacterium]|nr:class I SAM-dependent methyltransferase [Gammaproteobacteria bacterium]